MKSIFCLFFLSLSILLSANVKTNSLFTNNAVFQRGVEVPVWGVADENEKISVEFNGQTVETVTVNGKWMVKLKPMKENATPQKLVVNGKNKLVFENILVGEVWLCSGQSNMERQLGLRPSQKPILNWQAEAKDAANYPQIRQYSVNRNASSAKLDDAKGKWLVCDSLSVKTFTAVGFFFAKALSQNLNVPIGILYSAYGGTPAEKWTSSACLEATPGLKDIVDNYERSLKKYPEQLQKYTLKEDSLLNVWRQDTAAARLANKSLPKKPAPPVHPCKSGNCGGLYNAMISPLIPYAIKGVVWYQGESNASRAKQYQTLFPAMIADWRKEWSIGDFPFLYVQVAPFKEMIPEIRESQLLTLKKSANTAMVVTVDCGDSADIHPANKKPVGERLALAAMALAYKQKVAYSGPIYSSMKVKDNSIELNFEHVNKGLLQKGDALTDFVISEDGKLFVPAIAKIKGDKVIVSANGVLKPVAVRMGWSNVPHINMFNKDGLPASPFRTDME